MGDALCYNPPTAQDVPTMTERFTVTSGTARLDVVQSDRTRYDVAALGKAANARLAGAPTAGPVIQYLQQQDA